MKNPPMKPIVPFFIFTTCLLILTSCGSTKSRIRDANGLRQIKQIALINFAIGQNYTIGSGSKEKVAKNTENSKAFGKIHLVNMSNIIKDKKFPSFLDIKQVSQTKDYHNLKLENNYIRKGISYLDPPYIIHLFKGKKYINPINELGIVKLNSSNSVIICKALKVDGILSVETSYNLNAGKNLPLSNPDWQAKTKVKSALFDSSGRLVWSYKSSDNSPLKLKANESTNVIIYSSSSISGEQVIQLIDSVTKYCSQKLVDSLYTDIK